MKISKKMSLDASCALRTADFSNRSNISISIQRKDERGKQFEIIPENLEVYEYLNWLKRVIALSEADAISIVKLMAIGNDKYGFANCVVIRQVYREGNSCTLCLLLGAEEVDSDGLIILPTDDKTIFTVEPKDIRASGDSQQENWIISNLYESDLFSDPGIISLLDEISAIDFANQIRNAA